MKIKRFFTAFLCLLLLLQWATPVGATETQQPDEARKFNIMIVMDCSGSLVQGNTSDPYGYRYDATSMFLDLLSEFGNNVGAIVFNSTTSTTDSSDESMRMGLRLNTGLLPMNSHADKAALMDQIQSVKPGGYTDIGTALLTAAQTLEGMSAQNGLESIIVLFTDGMTETKDKQENPAADTQDLPVYAQSLKNGQKAVELIRSEDITLCGVYLSGKKGDPENSEVLGLVRSANGFSENATQNQVGDLYIPVQEASSLADAYQRFFTLISGISAKTFDDELTFRIPGSGVTDVNLNVTVRRSTLAQCSAVLDTLNVTIIRPDQSVLSSRELAEIMSRGSSYAVYKLQDPEPGIWTVRIDSASGNVDNSMLINTDVAAEFSYSIEADRVMLDKTVSATARLTKNGEPLATEADYQEYQCFLRLQNAATMEVWEVPMDYREELNAFDCKVYVQNYGEYYVNAVFRCGDAIMITSNMDYWDVYNSNPTAAAHHEIPIVLSFASSGVEKLDLATLVEDAEDTAEALTITLDPGKYDTDAYTYEGTVLTVDGAIGGQGTMYVTYTDTAGATATTQLDITFVDHTLRDTIITLACIGTVLAVLIVLLTIRWVRKRTGGKLEGSLQLTLPITNFAVISLKIAAQDCLNQNLMHVLKEHRVRIVESAALRRCKEADVDAFLEKNRKLLSAVRITSVLEKNSKRQVCRLTGLPDGEKQMDLPDQSETTLPLSGSSYGIRVAYDRYK